MDINNIAAIGALGISGVSGTYYLTMRGLMEFHSTGDKLTTQEDLEDILNKECEKLSITPNNVSIRFEYGDGETYARRTSRTTYEVVIGCSEFSTKKVIKHELCHIANGDCDKFEPEDIKGFILNRMRYFFIEEPRACLYGAFGIKL